MGLIVKKYKVLGNKGNRKGEVLFDSGARRSVIRKDIAKEIATLITLPVKYKFILADGKTELSTTVVCDICIQIDGKTICDQFFVLDKLSREVIVGANTMQSWDIKPDMKNEKVIVGVDSKAIELLHT